MSRFVRPETRRLELSDGDWILVKTRLTHGEQRAAFARLYVAGVEGTLKVNPLESGMAMIVAYLVDWSFVDDDGKPVVIRDLSPDDLTATLNGLDPDDFAEVKLAVEAHEEAIARERREEKKRRSSATGAGAISPSPSHADGLSSGSVT